MISVTCRRCLAENSIELSALLDSVSVPLCSSCGKTTIRGERREGAITAANYVLRPDVQTMRSLRRVPGLVRAVQLYAKMVNDNDLLLDRYAENIEISVRQLPEIHELYQEAGARLGFAGDNLPPLFVNAERQPQAGTAGVERAFICISSGLLEVMTAAEIVAVLGHELGHVQAGHFTYTSAIVGFRQFVGAAARMTPIAIDDLLVNVLGDPAVLAWVRAAERTADRAGMLAARQPRDMVTAMMKIAGAPPITVSELSYEAFVQQSERFEEMISRSTRRRLIMAKDAIQRTHPFPAVRVGEMIRLLESAAWFDILERVHDSDPGRWERACDHCDGLVAEWDVVCRHCAWTVATEDDNDAASGEPPPDVGAWREQLTDQAKRAGSWRPRRRGTRSLEPEDDEASKGTEIPV
jgi:Zn-dependent protease with chaperone function